MEVSIIHSKEICKNRTCLDYFIAWRNDLTSRNSSKTLTGSSKCSSHLQIEYITHTKEFISRHSSTKPNCEWGSFFLTSIILSRKSVYLYDLVGWITHPHRTDLVCPKMLGEPPLNM